MGGERVACGKFYFRASGEVALPGIGADIFCSAFAKSRSHNLSHVDTVALETQFVAENLLVFFIPLGTNEI